MRSNLPPLLRPSGSPSPAYSGPVESRPGLLHILESALYTGPSDQNWHQLRRISPGYMGAVTGQCTDGISASAVLGLVDNELHGLFMCDKTRRGSSLILATFCVPVLSYDPPPAFDDGYTRR